MFKKGEENWLKQEYEQEKKRSAKEFGRPVAQTEYITKNQTESPALFTQAEKGGTKNSFYEKPDSKQNGNFLKIYLLKKVFGIFGFIISWTLLTYIINFFAGGFLLYFVYIPPHIMNVIIFFIWGFIFLKLRYRVLSSVQ